MSIFGKIGKLFRKITSSKIGMIVGVGLAAAAIVFTAGAALGVAPLAMGWGGAAASVAGSLGLTGTAAGIVTGGLTAAGYGAALGGLGAAVMGGNIMEGAAGGALTGAVTGGVLGGFGIGVDPLASTAAASGAPASPATLIPEATGAIPGAAGQAPMVAAAGAAPAAPTALSPAVTGPIPGAAGTAMNAPAGGGGLFSAGGFLERNGALIGNAVGGIGKGLATGMAAKDAAESEDKRYQQVRDSYEMTGLDVPATAVDPRLPTPVERFGRPAAKARPRWRYDPQTRTVRQMEG